MKPLSTLTFAAMLSTIAPAISATAAIDCGTLPTCESLGYTDIVAQCPGKSLKCPFDTDKGTCLHEAAIGQIAYFPTKPASKGWLPCDGSTYPRADYPELAALLNTNIKENPLCIPGLQHFHGECSNTVFSTPDYRGYFLRVAGMYHENNGTSYNSYGYKGQIPKTIKYRDNSMMILATPQSEELPNITGSSGYYVRHYNKNNPTLSERNVQTGVFSITPSDITCGNKEPTGNTSGCGWWGDGTAIGFDASKSSSVYTNGGHVVPAHYNVFAYIYAGKVVNK